MLRAVLAATVAASFVLAPVTLAQGADASSALATDFEDTSAGDVALLDESDAVVGRDLLGRRKKKRGRKGKKRGRKGKKRGRKGKKRGRKGKKRGRKGKKRGRKGKKVVVHKRVHKSSGGKGGFVIKKGPVHRSSISCSARATSVSFSASKNAHVKAVAHAFKDACSNGGKKVDLVSIWKKDAAVVVAKAITSAQASCTASGNAYGCAAATSAARAWASATASAHAAAAATAINYCKCKKADAFAAAFAAGKAESFKAKISADVASDASADVCVKSVNGGTATASVKAISRCIEIKYAYVMAEATARALIAGECKWGVKAKADIDALVSGQIVSKKKC